MQTTATTNGTLEFSKYFSLEEFRALSLNALTHSVSEDGVTATLSVTAEYTEGGVLLHARVRDADLIMGKEKKEQNDYFEMLLQAAPTSAAQKDYEYKVAGFADGSYSLWQWDGDNMVAYTPDAADYTYTPVEYAEGYGADIFLSYPMLQVDAEAGHGNVRLLLRLRDVCATHNAYSESRLLGTHGSYPNTWFVLDTDNRFVRRDYDAFALKDVGIPETASVLASLAAITPTNGHMQQTLLGATAVFDESYGLGYGLATDLVEVTDYVFAPRGENTVTALTDGYILLAVPMNNGEEIPAALESDGWTCLAKNQRDYLQFGNSANHDYTYLIAYYAKHFTAGESFAPPVNYSTVFGAHTDAALPEAVRTTPAYPVRLDGSEPAFYSDAEQVFNCGPSLDVTSGGKVYAAYMSGGTKEPHLENFMVIVRSDDGGKTWQRVIALDTWLDQTIGGKKETLACETQFTYNPETGKLHVFYWNRNASTKLTSLNNTHSANTCTWMFTIENPDAEDIEELVYSEPRMIFPGLARNRALILSDGTWIHTATGMTDQRFNIVYASIDGGETWTERGTIYAPLCRTWDEIMFVEKENGVLWATFRTANGVVYQSFSFDKGATWTISTPTGIRNPNSRFNITRLPSGALLMVYSDHASSRLGMTVALSYDDGETWTNKVCIYPEYCSYPDVAIAPDGRIHIIFDAYRTKNHISRTDAYGNPTWAYIYHLALTEEEIAAYGEQSADATELLVFGDSYMMPKYWAVFPAALGTYGAVNIAAEGKTLADFAAQVGTLSNYAPKKILLHVGLNDICYQGKSGAETGAAIVSLLQAMQAECPDSEIYYCEMIPNTAFPTLGGEIETANAAVRTYIEGDATGRLYRIAYADALVYKGNDYASNFAENGLHLDSHAYGVLTNAVWKATGLGMPVETLDIITRAALPHLCSVSCGYCAFAGSGTAEDPILLGTLSDYYTFAKQSQSQSFDGVYIRLTADITLPEDNTLIYRIGSQSYAFGGILDGDGHTVTVNVPDSTYVNAALIQTLGADGVVKNLTVTGTISSTKGYVAGIAGYSYGRIENCVCRATLESGDPYIGGIAAKCSDGAVFEKCVFTGSILQLDNANYAGGITGHAGAGCVFTDCLNSGSVSGARYSVGGIAGYATAVTVTRCGNTGTISAPKERGQVGGIVGELVTGCTSIIGCHNTGTLSGGSAVGNLVGVVNVKAGNTLTFRGGTAEGTIDCSVAPADEFYGTLKTGSVEKLHAVGDMDADGELTLADALYLLKAALNNTEIELEGADLNADGKVSLLDVLRILKMLIT